MTLTKVDSPFPKGGHFACGARTSLFRCRNNLACTMDVDKWLKEHASKRGKANMVKFIMERENQQSTTQAAGSTKMVPGAVVDQANALFSDYFPFTLDSVWAMAAVSL